MSNVIVIGGGAAGMMTAITAARYGLEVTLIEKNEKLGKKLFITGKGRCNVTNAGDEEDIRNAIVSNEKFMYSSLATFSNYDMMGFLDELGLKIKVERGNRVFPESDHSSDVIKALEKELNNLSVKILLNCQVLEILTNGQGDKNENFNSKVSAVKLKHINSDREETIYAEKIVVATGGISYPQTGSTGDGFKWARELGIEVTNLYPALVPIQVKEDFINRLMGLSLKNVTASVYDGKKELYSDFGEMLFTHFGVSGPIILSASSKIAKTIKNKALDLYIDLKPALSEEQLDERILRDFDDLKNKAFKNSLDKLLPKKIIPIIIEMTGIDPNKKVNEIKREERLRLVEVLKNFHLTLTNLRGFNEAIITQGGINCKEINPKTLESKKVSGLYFVGEVMDVDALTGGFNLQMAWSMAYACGSHMLEQ